MDLKQFRQLVDNCHDNITKYDDLKPLYEYVGLPTNIGFMSRDTAKAELYKKIANSFTAGHHLVWDLCNQFKQLLIQGHILDNTQTQPYFSVLEHLMDAIRSSVNNQGEISGNWEMAIQHASDYTHLSIDLRNHEQAAYQRWYEVAYAAKKLQLKGYHFSRVGTEIYFTPQSEEKIVLTIENLVKSIGGLNVVRRVFKSVAHLYNSKQERYHLVRKIPRLGMSGAPQVPYNYILSLGIKHAFCKKPYKNSDSNWLKLIEFVKLYTTVLDVQNYFPPAFKTYDGKGLLSTLQAEGLYDSLFTFQQMRPQDTLEILRGVLIKLDFNTTYGSGWTLNEVLHICNALLEVTKNNPSICIVNKQELYKQCTSMTSQQVDKVLYDVLCHPKQGANQNYSKATDAPFLKRNEEKLGHDFFLRPLLQNKNDLYLIDRSICAPAFIEAIFTELRKVHKEKLENVIVGYGVEAFIKEKLTLHGINCIAGKYRVNGIDGECDVVIETTEAIIFIETKKKALTRNARAGSDVHVLLDLTQSVLMAQKQAGGHEATLRQNGFIHLSDNGAEHTITLNGRHVERIALTLFDYGGFQDRILLKQFLETNLRLRYNVNEPKLQGKFDDLNESIESIVKQEVTLSDFRSDNHNRQPFFNCWFLSLPQLLVLLDDVHTSDDFKEQLWRTRSITHGSQDFYYEYHLMQSWLHQSTEKSVVHSLIGRDNTNIIIT